MTVGLPTYWEYEVEAESRDGGDRSTWQCQLASRQQPPLFYSPCPACSPTHTDGLVHAPRFKFPHTRNQRRRSTSQIQAGCTVVSSCVGTPGSICAVRALDSLQKPRDFAPRTASGDYLDRDAIPGRGTATALTTVDGSLFPPRCISPSSDLGAIFSNRSRNQWYARARCGLPMI